MADDTVPVLPAGMVALDNDCVVRIANIAMINRIDDDHCTVAMTQGGTLTVDCDLEELLRRIAVQNRRDLPQRMGFGAS